MDEREERNVLWSVPLVAAALGCAPNDPTSLDASTDETDTEDGGSSEEEGESDGGEPGGGVPDGVAPQLISAQTDDTGKYVLLRFSEPMASPGGVDPSDFRISYARTYTDYRLATYYRDAYQYEISRYYDPHQYFDYEPPYTKSMIISVTEGGLPTDLLLEFDDPLPMPSCELIEQMQAEIEQAKQEDENYDARIGLFPHFSPGTIPVRSAQGEPLAEIGPEWVEFDVPFMHMYWDEFGFPNLSPQIPLDCLLGE